MTANTHNQDLVIWSNEYSVQLPEIDEQHQILVACINSLWRALAVGQDQKIIGELLESLWIYTETHFLAEEILMEEAGYPELEIHQQIHLGFIEKLNKVVKSQADGKPIGLELLQFLTDWLINHIKVADRQFANFVRPKLSGGILTHFEPLSRAINFVFNLSSTEDEEQILVGLDMRRAIETHTAWITRLRNYVDDKPNAMNIISVDDIAKEDLCILGNWIKVNSSKPWAEDLEFQRLRDTHRIFHRTAAEVVTHKQSNNLQAANRIIKGELRRLSNEIRIEIVRLYSKINS